jgi:hypothetical protein
MRRYTVKTVLTFQEAMEKARAYFEPGGQGLTLTSQRKRALRWEGGNGFVDLTVKAESPTLLEIETREWEDAVDRFIAQLPQRRPWWARWRRQSTAAKPPLARPT